jgi:hypothetical protein
MFDSRGYFMTTKDISGTFTANLFSLQIQLKSLFDDAGGESSVKLLDKLSRLTPTEQKLALSLFQKVIERVLSGELRVASERDKFMKELEDTLYSDILDSMKEASGDIPLSHSSQRTKPTRKLEILDGGKGSQNKEKTIDMAKAREARKVSIKPLMN